MNGKKELLKKFVDEVDEKGPDRREAHEPRYKKSRLNFLSWFHSWLNPKEYAPSDKSPYPKGRHSKLQKLCGQYLAMDGGPFRRELKELRAEYKIGDWPADIFAEWELDSGRTYSEVVEVQTDCKPMKNVTVDYSDLKDAFEKLEYLEKSGSVSRDEAGLIRQRVDDAARAGLENASFWFRPIKGGTIYRLIGKGWDVEYESELERKFRLAGKSDGMISFCVPYESYSEVLGEIEQFPDMNVGFVYTYIESDGAFRMAKAIPVLQGINLKEYHKPDGATRMAEPEKMANLFAYGTLTDSDFVGKLCGRPVEMAEARLEGYAKTKLEGGSYHIATKRDGSEIEGKLLLDLTSDELRMLDFWEECSISKDELLGHRDEIWELVKNDRLEGFPKISSYRRVLEPVVTTGNHGRNRMDALVYVR